METSRVLYTDENGWTLCWSKRNITSALCVSLNEWSIIHWERPTKEAIKGLIHREAVKKELFKDGEAYVQAVDMYTY